jgi:heat shock protein HslJ
MQQLAGKWVLTNIDGTDVPGSVLLSLEFDQFTLLGVSTCNEFKARVKFSDIGIKFVAIEAGDTICGKAAMAQETTFLDAVARVDAYTMTTGDVLTFFDSLLRPIITARRAMP